MASGTAGRFGARYGKKIRENTEAVEQQYRKRSTCPSCRSTALKRDAAGIWRCRSCGTVTAGKAYTPPTEIDRTVTRRDVTALTEEDTEETSEPAVTAEEETPAEEEPVDEEAE